jgi:hypothetical protein
VKKHRKPLKSEEDDPWLKRKALCFEERQNAIMEWSEDVTREESPHGWFLRYINREEAFVASTAVGLIVTDLIREHCMRHKQQAISAPCRTGGHQEEKTTWLMAGPAVFMQICSQPSHKPPANVS